jgi:mRNA export factor
MDTRGSFLSVALSELKVSMFDLRNLGGPSRTVGTEPLQFQSRCISMYADGLSWVLGSIEARCAIRWVDESADSRDKFTFRSHRINTPDDPAAHCYAINCVAAHPSTEFINIFATAASDGTYSVWDRVVRQRTVELRRATDVPITAMAWNPNGHVLAYAHGYDWHKGGDFYDPSKFPVSIHWRNCTESDLVAKPSSQPAFST